MEERPQMYMSGVGCGETAEDVGEGHAKWQKGVDDVSEGFKVWGTEEGRAV